ncbi:hypothetical protein H6800_01650 [Candidatus Nomurabacteria bacterium]|nr:hypothetical protein [Candidatus Nomurabacteria bacterium]
MAGSPAHLFETVDHLAGDPIARALFERRVYGKVVAQSVDTETAEADGPKQPDYEYTD